MSCYVKIFKNSHQALTFFSDSIGNLPNISFINRKPDPLGTELKVVACGCTGVLCHLELQRVKEGMCNAEYVNLMMKTAAYTMCLMKCSCKRDENGEVDEEEAQENPKEEPKTTYLADSWFGSISSVLAAASLGDNLICIVKTCHGGTPKLFLEHHMKSWPAGSNLALQATVRGVDMVCVGYNYLRKKVLTFLFNKGAGSLKNGVLYIARWKDEHLNTMSKLVPCPSVVAKYFQDSNKVDSHNQSRQFDLALEKMWVTRCGFLRLNTTIFGMCVVNAWKVFRHHLT